ncbi:MAG: hypothetical protein SFV21_06700 [Rhodospirillaceae bacterium]|nr:hypothetical protein [Rhodospirillaceae bacterium]
MAAMLVTGGALVAGSLEANAQAPVFGATFLSGLDADTTTSVALSVNNQGRVVGFGSTANGLRGFLWSAASDPVKLEDLAGGGEHSIARAINDQGVVVGESIGIDADSATIWFGSSSYQPARLQSVAGQAAGTSSRATSINLQNHVVGRTGNFMNRRAAVWTAGPPNLLQMVGEQTSSMELTAVSNLGAVVGRIGTASGTTGAMFASPSGQGRVLSTFGQPGYAIAMDVNTSSTVVGGIRRPNRIPAMVNQLRPVLPIHNVKPMLWIAAQFIGDLTRISGSPVAGEANSVNEGGDIVGIGYVESGARAYMWSARYGAVDLNDVVGNIAPYTLVSANSISERGVIVGSAVNTETRTTHAFILTPM